MNKRNAVVLISVITAVSLGGAGAYYVGQIGNGGNGDEVLFEYEGELIGCGMTPNVTIEATRDMRVTWTSDISLTVKLRWDQGGGLGEVLWVWSGSDVMEVIQINHADEGREFHVHWNHYCLEDEENRHLSLTIETLTQGQP